MLKHKVSTLLLVASFSATAPALAQDTGFYLGASLGQSIMHGQCDGLIAGVSCDDKDTTWKLFGGYNFNRFIAAELGYSDKLGKASASGFGLAADVKASAWELVAIGSYPFAGRFAVYGKLGAYYASTKGTSNFGISADDSNANLTFGVGLRFDITRSFAARAEWQRYSKVGGEDVGKGDIDAMNLGLLYRF
jgi:OOP family OmpA-OmpF porin